MSSEKKDEKWEPKKDVSTDIKKSEKDGKKKEK